MGLQCVTLIKWLEERYETVYRQHPGFQEGSSPLSLQEQVLPLDLPDTLRGEEWAFVQLPFESAFCYGSVLVLLFADASTSLVQI